MVKAIILSGGIGSRIGLNTPKQYIEVMGKSIISYSLETLFSSELIDSIRIVAGKEWHGEIKKIIEKNGNKRKFDGFSEAGLNRQLSIYNALLDMKKDTDENDYVFIHDSARPMLSKELINSIIENTKDCDGVLPVLRAKDTMYLQESEGDLKLLNRDKIFSGQAPEIFIYGKYLNANQKLLGDMTEEKYIKNMHDEEKISRTKIYRINGSTEPAILHGMKIKIVDGDEKNFKITTKEDLERFESIVQMKGGHA